MEFVMIFKLFNTNLKDMTLKTKKKKGGGAEGYVPYITRSLSKGEKEFSQNIC